MAQTPSETPAGATARPHPAVDRVTAELTRLGVTPEVRWFDDAVTTAQAAADALGIDIGQIANSLVFLRDDVPILVMTSGAHRVDTDWLGERLGGTISRAPKDRVKQATGQTIGGVAPVGHPAPVPTFVDTMLAEHEEIWAAAGHPRTVFRTTCEELLRITGGTPVSVRPAAGQPEAGA